MNIIDYANRLLAGPAYEERIDCEHCGNAVRGQAYFDPKGRIYCSTQCRDEASCDCPKHARAHDGEE